MAPLIRLLGQYHRAIPMAIFGSAPVVGGLLCILLPETRGTDLVDDTGVATPELRWVPRTLNLRQKNSKRANIMQREIYQKPERKKYHLFLFLSCLQQQKSGNYWKV